MVGSQIRRGRQIGQRNERQDDDGTSLLPVESALDVEQFVGAVRGHWGIKKQSALGPGCLFPGRSKSGASRLRCRESGHPAPVSAQHAQTRENQKARHQRQTTQRRLVQYLFLFAAPPRNLAASA